MGKGFVLFFIISGALKDVLDAFELPDSKTRMDEVKSAAGNDMMKMMQIVFPVVTQIQQEVIAKYGFTTDGEGKFDFIVSVQELCIQIEVLRQTTEHNRSISLRTRTHWLMRLINEGLVVV